MRKYGKKLPYLGKKLPYFGYRLPRFKGRPLYLVGVRVRVRVWSRRKSPCAGKITWVMVVFLPFFTQKKFLNIWKKVTLFGKKITVCRYRSPLQGPLYLVGLRVSSRWQSPCVSRGRKLPCAEKSTWVCHYFHTKVTFFQNKVTFFLSPLLSL